MARDVGGIAVLEPRGDEKLAVGVRGIERDFVRKHGDAGELPSFRQWFGLDGREGLAGCCQIGVDGFGLRLGGERGCVLRAGDFHRDERTCDLAGFRIPGQHGLECAAGAHGHELVQHVGLAGLQQLHQLLARDGLLKDDLTGLEVATGRCLCKSGH